ncbi:hypothetical protein PENSPDRAFT_760430 [Peniophora sp. CONT]|nr:hypothetical protein PENSPDRAFT_760430 [Peniophora sp. CONT]
MQTQESMDIWLASHERVLNSLPHPSGGARDAEAAGVLKAWDAQLSKMHTTFAAALECRNELVPISALPAELLARIFSHLADIWPVNSNDHSGMFVTGGWSRIALICRRWRAVAIECASLWATVSLDGNEPIDMFLERAKTSPLRVIGRVAHDSDDEFQRIQCLIGNFDRFKSLDLDVVYDYTEAPKSDTLIFGRLMTTKSNIETLSVCTIRASDDGWDSHTSTRANGQFRGPSHTFVSTVAPQLATVNLAGYLFPWGAGSSSLRSLTLSWTGAHPPQTHALADILDSLRAMPALERLVLTDCLPHLPQSSQDFINKQSMISLPQLKDMQLACYNETCWILWALLDTHTSANIRIHSKRPSTTGLVEMAFSRHVQRSGLPEYTALRMWQTSSTSLSIILSDTDHSDDAPPTNTADADINLHIESDSLDDLSLRILRVVPLENLETLSLRGTCYRWTHVHIAPMFVNALRLRCLKLRGTNAAWAFSSLLYPESTLNEPIDHAAFPPLPLPSLVEVHVKCVNLMTSSSLDHADYKLCLGDQLVSALGLRGVSQGRIHRLSVKRSEVAPDLVPMWLSFVTDVDWDGEESGDHQVEERELSQRVNSWGDEDEIDFLGEDAQSTNSFEWEAEGLSEADEEDEDEEDWM